MKLAKSIGRLGTETAFEVLAKAKKLEAQGKDIVHLEIGEPDFETPDHIKEAAKKALDDNFTHYVPSPGLMEVREVIAEHQSAVHNKNISPENVVFTPGAKPIMFFTIMALIEPGDEVIYPNPGFVTKILSIDCPVCPSLLVIIATAVALTPCTNPVVDIPISGAAVYPVPSFTRSIDPTENPVVKPETEVAL